jgi:hypothetical protein
MSIKITIPNTSSDVLTFGSANTPTAAQIAGIDSGSSNGQLALYTTASGTSTERVRVDASGNVGIGTASPAYKLQANAGSSNNNNDANTIVATGTNHVRLKVHTPTTGGFRASLVLSSDEAVTATGNEVSISTTGSDEMQFATGGTERARIDSSGNLLVGKTAADTTTAGSAILPAYGGANIPAMSLAGASSSNSQLGYHQYSTSAAAFRFYVGYGGTVYATSTTITGISDQRLKENIRDLDDGLEKVLLLKPRKFDWKEGKGADIKDARGFIAQEFEIVFPDMVEEWKDPAPEGEDPYKAVNANLIPTLVKAIQEQQALITQLQADVAALKGASA